MPASRTEVEVEWHASTGLLLELEASASTLEELRKRMAALLEGMAALSRWVIRIVTIVKARSQFCGWRQRYAIT